MEEEYHNIIFEVRREFPYLMSLEDYLELWRFYTENKLLTEKQALFCAYWDIYRNKTKAYRLAYGCSERTANINGNRLFKKSDVRLFIAALERRTSMLAQRQMRFMTYAKRVGLPWQMIDEGLREVGSG